MQNPIIQALNATKRQSNNIWNVISMLKSGNPDEIYEQMKRSNPQFRRFAEENEKKPVQQIAEENGIDMGFLNSLLG